VTVRLRGAAAIVTVKADGLLAGSPHLMHIHAGRLGRCPPASAARMHRGHRTISTLDGAPFYGKVAVSLTTRGETSARSFLAFARYPLTGTVRYTRRVPVAADVARQIRRSRAVILLHGIDYNGNGIYDAGLDRSDLDRSLPGEATAPALCAPLVGANPPRSSTARGRLRPIRVGVASLTLASGAPLAFPHAVRAAHGH